MPQKTLPVKPLHDYLLVEIVDVDSGVVKSRDIRDTTFMGRKGKILAVGPGIETDYGTFKNVKVKEGDVVYWEEAAEANTPQELKDNKLALIKYARLIAQVV